MRTLATNLSLTLAFLATADGAVQQPASAAPDTTRQIAIDAAAAPSASVMQMPTARIVPDAAVDLFDLGEVRPRPQRLSTGQAQDHRAEVGYVEDVAQNFLAFPNWQQREDGSRVWSVELSSPGAAALRAKLHGRWGHDGLQLRVYDPVSGVAFGPYSRPKLDENGDWWTTLIAGDTIGLEFFYPPSDESDINPLLPAITGVIKNWPDADVGGDQGGTRGGLACSHNDVMCDNDWILSGRAVVRYSYVENGGNFVCSGALLNRNPSDLSPLLLTADHCIDTQATANSCVFIWRYRTPSCGGTPPANTNGFPRNDGALLLKTRDNSDVSLLGLYEPPLGDLWLGWDSGGWTLQSNATGIHHPGGSWQRISHGDVTVALWVTYGQNDAHVWRVDWDSGATEGGSSGSPVLDSSGRIRGQLKGGPDCGPADYGRFGVSFDTLEPYISNMASPIYVQAGAGGDQRGTSGDPFDQVFEATFCVFEGDEVRISAGTYNESFTLWRPMTLNATGGTVRIGG